MDAARAQLDVGRTTTRATIAAVKSAATASAIEGASSLPALKALKGLVAVTKHPAGHARWRCCVDQ